MRAATSEVGATLATIGSGGKQHYLLPEVLADWQLLVKQAQLAGFEPIIVSAYRSYDRQLVIWNAKATGQRPVLDDDDNRVDMDGLTDLQKIHAIMRFSALPGASRHHWGSDFDVMDTATLPPAYDIQLTASETAPEGVCGAFFEWLDKHLSSPNCAFFRPYEVDYGGVACEPWHLSHKSAAKPFEAGLTLESLRSRIQGSNIALKDALLANLSMLYEQYIAI